MFYIYCIKMLEFPSEQSDWGLNWTTGVLFAVGNRNFPLSAAFRPALESNYHSLEWVPRWRILYCKMDGVKVVVSFHLHYQKFLDMHLYVLGYPAAMLNKQGATLLLTSFLEVHQFHRLQFRKHWKDAHHTCDCVIPSDLSRKFRFGLYNFNLRITIYAIITHQLRLNS